MYEPTMPMRMGKIFTIPLPQMLHTTIMASAMKASSQLDWQFVMALGARIRPMAMMMGPVTTGGKKRIIRFTPNTLIRAAKTT